MRSIRRILCPVDFTTISDRGLQLATELATRFRAELVLQHNLATGSALGVSWMHEQEHHGEAAAVETSARKKLAALLGQLPRPVRERARGALTYGSLHHCVENLATQADVDLIVIGTHGRVGTDHPSETERLIGHAPCPVLTTRDDAPHEWLQPMPTTLIPTVVPVDFSAHSLAALRYALELRHQLPLQITVLYVPQRPELGTGWAEAELAKALPGEARSNFKLDVRAGKPVDEILAEETSLHARLVVMGAHVPGWIERLLFQTRSTSREILHRSACPVWFVSATANG